MEAPQAERLGQAITAVRPHQMGAIPVVYPILAKLQMRQATTSIWAGSSCC